jgi:hypothetical protein
MLYIATEANVGLLKNCQNYSSRFDGTAKDFSDVSYLFNNIYSDDFFYQVDSNLQYYDKSQMEKVHANFLALRSKATILLFKDVGADQVEYKLHIVNDLLDVVLHNIATVKDNKVIKCRPVDHATMKAVSNVRDVSELFDAANDRPGKRDSIFKILDECIDMSI